jgi:hypothetical protein
MSRIAEAYARAGRRLPVEDADRWETDCEVAASHLVDESPTSTPAPSHPPPDPQSPAPDPLEFEPVSAIRTIIQSPKAAVRSVLRLLTR